MLEPEATAMGIALRAPGLRAAMLPADEIAGATHALPACEVEGPQHPMELVVLQVEEVAQCTEVLLQHGQATRAAM